MKLSIKGRIFAAVGLAVLLGATYMYISSPPGYCRAQKRYIPDEEFLNASIALLYWDMNSMIKSYPDGKVGKKKDVLSTYKEIDFDPTNPNCCKVYRNREPSVFKRLFQCEDVYVRLNNRTSKGPIGGEHFYEFHYDGCGKLISSYLGNYKVTISNYKEKTGKQ